MKLFQNCSLNGQKQAVFIFSTILMLRYSVAKMKTHVKCRGGTYPGSNVQRFPVPENKVHWSSHLKTYNPPNYTSPSIYGKPWADPQIGDANFNPTWNNYDEVSEVDRTSYVGKYHIKADYPLNPMGRTGITGRGLLGRWGPNHAADPLVSRWKKLNTGHDAFDNDNKPILQVIMIKRGDCGEWALPGGMIDPGEEPSQAAFREFREEAMNSLQMDADEQEIWSLELERFFAGGEAIYQGYVDDPRNTDNAWMETVAFNFHDETGKTVGKLTLQAGDDAVSVGWIDVTPDLKLYASHKHLVEATLKKRLKVRAELADSTEKSTTACPPQPPQPPPKQP